MGYSVKVLADFPSNFQDQCSLFDTEKFNLSKNMAQKSYNFFMYLPKECSRASKC